MNALSFQNVALRVGNKLLLQGICLEVPATGMLGIVGPNGSGKTSLLRTALGLLQPHVGRVSLAGRDVSTWPAPALARHVGYLAQHLESHWDLTVHEMLTLQVSQLPEDLVQRCELTALLGQRFANLSGGERARVGIARGLAHAPALLLADETCAHLDIPHHHRLMALLRDVARERAVVVVLHDLHVAATYCNQLALLGQGGLLACGAPDEVLLPTLLDQAYGAPIRMHEWETQHFFTGDPIS